MPVIEYEGAKIKLSDEGYLENMDDWNENVANAIAKQEGLSKLTRQHMDIIKFLREYYKNYNYFPILNAVCLNVHQPKGCMTEEFMHPLKAWKIAGLPKPNYEVLMYLNYGQVPT